MEIELFPGQEYRIELKESRKLRIMVLAGIGEINGQELLNEKWYPVGAASSAIYTFTGMKLRVDGTPDLGYVASSSMFPTIFSIFSSLPPSPTLLVVGNGRSTFCSTLLNYYARTHKKAVFTELDVAAGNIFPGCLSSLRNEYIVDYREGIRLSNPICLFYGDTVLSNMELYETELRRLSELVDERFFAQKDSGDEASEDINSSRNEIEQGNGGVSVLYGRQDGERDVLGEEGEELSQAADKIALPGIGVLELEKEKSHNKSVAVNTGNAADSDAVLDALKGERTTKCMPHIILAPNFEGAKESDRCRNYEKICKLYAVTDVVVVGDERMYHLLNLSFPKLFVENTGYVKECKINRSIARYFNGLEGELSTSSLVLKGGCEIVRVGDEYEAPDSALPLGLARTSERIQVNRVEIVEGSVIGISEAEDEDEIVSSPVIGFLVCTDAKKMKVTCTQAKLPKKKYLVQGNLRFADF